MGNRTLLILIIILITVSSSIAQQNNGYDFVITEDGCYIWFIDERAVIKNHRLYASYVNIAGYAGVSVVDLTTGQQIGDDVNLSSWTQADDHNLAALLPMSNGKIMSLYTLHDARSTQYFRISNVDEPLTESDWGPEQSYPTPGSATYNNAYQLSAEGGRIYNFFRVGTRDPHFITFDSDGNVDGPVKHLIINEGQWWNRAYSKYVTNGVDQIDYFFTNGHPHATSTSLFHMYYKGDNFYHSNGDLIGPVSELPFTVDRGTPVYTQGDDGTNRNPWNHEVQYDKNGAPVLLYSHQADATDIEYYMGRYNSNTEEWELTWVADAGNALIVNPPFGGEQPDYAGGITMSPYNDRVFFISTDVSPIDSTATDTWEIYRGTLSEAADTFTWQAITQNSEQGNYRPFIPKGAATIGEQAVIWFTGKYNQFNQGTLDGTPVVGYDTRIVGRYINEVSTGILQNSNPGFEKNFKIKVQRNSIHLNFLKPENYSVKLRDVQGSVVFRSGGVMTGNIKVNNLSQGMYILQVATDSQLYSIKVSLFR